MQEAPVLRPLSVGDVLDRTFRLIRSNFLLFLAIAALPQLVIEVLQRGSGLTQTVDFNSIAQALDPRSVSAPSRQAVPSNGVLLVAVGIVSLVVTFAVYNAITVAMAE